MAKEIYVAQAEMLMQLLKETDDDPNFQASVKVQLKAVIKKAEIIKQEMETGVKTSPRN